MRLLRFGQINESIKFESIYHKYTEDDIADFLLDLTDIGFDIKSNDRGLFDKRDNSFMEDNTMDDVNDVDDFLNAYSVNLVKAINSNTDTGLKVIAEAADILMKMRDRNIKHILDIHTKLEIFDEDDITRYFDFKVDEIDENPDDLVFTSNYIVISITMTEEYLLQNETNSEISFRESIEAISTDILGDEDFVMTHSNGKFYGYFSPGDARTLKDILDVMSDYVKSVKIINDRNIIENFIRNCTSYPSSYNTSSNCGSMVEVEYKLPDDIDDIENKIHSSVHTTYRILGKYIIVDEDCMKVLLNDIEEEYDNSSYKIIRTSNDDSYYIFELVK